MKPNRAETEACVGLSRGSTVRCRVFLHFSLHVFGSSNWGPTEWLKSSRPFGCLFVQFRSAEGQFACRPLIYFRIETDKGTWNVEEGQVSVNKANDRLATRR